ncbi:MAG: hypothetical protein Q9171_001141 [Xanthocarpia ochracea]
MTKQRTLRLSTRNLRHANGPTETIHILTATPAAAAGMVQGQATIHRAEDGDVVQIPKQEKTQAEDEFAPTWPYSTSVVQADVYCFRRVSIPSLTRFARVIRLAPAKAFPGVCFSNSGDITTLSTICTEGLLASFKSRIAARSRKERLRWTLHKFVGSPRFVSHRVAILPYKGSAIRQVVVRLRSRQSLARLVSMGPGRPDALLQGTGDEKPVSEYLVLQRRMWKEVEEPWMIWGTTDETDPDTVLKSNVQTQKTANT